MKITLGVESEERQFDLPDETIGALQQIAERNGLPLGLALHRAITNENFIEKLAADRRLLVEQDDSIRRLDLDDRPKDNEAAPEQGASSQSA